MTSFFRKLWARKIIRFIVIGSFNTLLDTSLLLTIVKITDWSALIANCFSVSVAITVSYFLNHRIVFRSLERYSLKKYVRFFLVTGLGVILIQDLIIYIVTDRVWRISKTKTFMFLGHNMHSQTAELLGTKLSAVVIGMVWNFLLYKYVVFRGHESKDIKEEELIIG
jgi:putative flippase GtrA